MRKWLFKCFGDLKRWQTWLTSTTLLLPLWGRIELSLQCEVDHILWMTFDHTFQVWVFKAIKIDGFEYKSAFFCLVFDLCVPLDGCFCHQEYYPSQDRYYNDVIYRFTGRDQFKTYLRLPQDISTHWGSKRSELFGEKVFGKTARNNRKTIGDRVQL